MTILVSDDWLILEVMMRLTKLAPEIWAYTDSVRTLPAFYFPARTVVVRLPDRQLWVHAPLAIDDELAAELAGLGEVRWLVAPNGFHHLYFAAVAKRYPTAETWLAPALKEKRPELTATGWLGDELPHIWTESFDTMLIPGAPKVTESVFLHRPSKTLIVTDLVFNIREARGWLSPIILSMVGAWKKPGQSGFWRSFVKDRAAAVKAVRDILTWDFDRVVVAHGEVIEGSDVRAVMEAGIAKMLAWTTS